MVVPRMRDVVAKPFFDAVASRAADRPPRIPCTRSSTKLCGRVEYDTRMAFPVGAEVVVRTLRNKRGLVIEAGRNGRYRVRVEGMTTSCREADLAAAPVSRKSAHQRPGPRETDLPDSSSTPAAPSPGRVDLHGLLVDEGLARLMDEIDRALQRGAARVEVLHGKGSGRMRDAVHRRLASLTVVAAFKLDGDNPGVTWVYF
jgi:dsDNA-specific endonuclease/ATPase MutS2